MKKIPRNLADHLKKYPKKWPIPVYQHMGVTPETRLQRTFTNVYIIMYLTKCWSGET